MTLLILGLLLWSGAHLFKRIAPDARARMGEKGKGPIALVLLASVVLMVIGYRMADGPFWWGRSPALVGINNLLMLFAFYLFAASGSKTWITTKIRHPQLTAVKTFAVAHLLVNGDLPSFILFGGLLAWAVVEVVLINRAEPEWTPAHDIPASSEIKAIVATIVVVVIVMLIHNWLGYRPWG